MNTASIEVSCRRRRRRRVDGTKTSPSDFDYGRFKFHLKRRLIGAATLGTTTLSINDCQHNDTQQQRHQILSVVYEKSCIFNVMLKVVMLSVVLLSDMATFDLIRLHYIILGKLERLSLTSFSRCHKIS